MRNPKIAIEYVQPASLNAAPYNPRRIDRKALAALARLLDEHGFVEPVVARREDRLLIGGHQRLKANATRPKPAESVPCVFLDGIDDRRCKALNVALNNPAAQGRFEPQLLAETVADIALDGLDVSALTGLPPQEVADLASLLQDVVLADLPIEEAPPTPADNVLVIFEMTGEVYRTLRPRLDELAAEAGVCCHVRADGSSSQEHS